jgi:hypothetical protein
MPEMTEKEWQQSDDPGLMLGMLQGLVSERKLRLLSVACFRCDNVTCSDWRNEAEAVERFADGLLTATECDEVLANSHPGVATFVGAYRLLEAATSANLWRDACTGASKAGVAAKSRKRMLWSYRDPRSAVYIREIFAYPFKPIILNPAWLPAFVRALAEQIYDDKAFDRMPVLGDALEHAGCTVNEVLAHCRSVQEHCRGCWLLDKILGRE